MRNFLIIYKDEEFENCKYERGNAETERGFLEQLDKEILESDSWVVFTVENMSGKSEYLHSGQIDDLLEGY